MIIYTYKGVDYFSLEECLRKLPKIALPTINSIPEAILFQLGVSKRYVDDATLSEIIPKQMEKVRNVRDRLLKSYDKHVLPNYPIEQLDLDNIIAYRQYLRDYTKTEEWWKSSPKTLEEWTNYDNELYF